MTHGTTCIRGSPQKHQKTEKLAHGCKTASGAIASVPKKMGKAVGKLLTNRRAFCFWLPASCADLSADTLLIAVKQVQQPISMCSHEFDMSEAKRSIERH